MRKQRTRGIALFLSVVMCLSVVPPVYAAEHTAALRPTVNNVAPGETVIVTLELSGSVTCEAYLFNLQYPTAFTVESVRIPSGSASRGGATTVGEYQIERIIATGTFTNATTLAEITFLVSEDADAGEYEISLVDDGHYIQFEPAGDTIADVSKAVVQVAEKADPPSVPTGSYSAWVTAPASATKGDQDVQFTITVDGDRFAAAQMCFTYDSDKLQLTDVSVENWSEAPDGTITVVDFGAEKTTPASYTLTFTALSAGTASVELESVLLGNADTAASENAAPAVITASVASVNIAKPVYSVTLPDIFVGADSVTENEDYTFAPADSSNYLYSNVQATVGDGQAQTLTADAQGNYTVPNVTGNVRITGERTAKSHTITFRSSTGVDLPAAQTVTYGVEWRFTIPAEDDYDTSVTSVKMGDAAVPFTVSDGVIIIAGDQLTGDITVTLDRERNNATVSIPSQFSGLLSGGAKAEPGKDYTVTLTPDKRYSYAVTATVNGETVQLAQSGNTYTISGADIKAGDRIEFDVVQTVRTDKLDADHYLQLNGKALYLVVNRVARESDFVYLYNGIEMFWSDRYDAYCCLVTADSKAEALGFALALEEGTDRALTDGTDVNLSGVTDINDAQFIYNLYNAKYADFTDSVTMEKVLSADMDGDGKISISDAQMIVHAILQAQ